DIVNKKGGQAQCVPRARWRAPERRYVGRHQGFDAPSFDGSMPASLSTWRSCGKPHIQISITMIAPTPPISAEDTAPSQAAMAPARNSPSEPDEPVNMALTAATRPSMS